MRMRVSACQTANIAGNITVVRWPPQPGIAVQPEHSGCKTVLLFRVTTFGRSWMGMPTVLRYITGGLPHYLVFSYGVHFKNAPQSPFYKKERLGV